MRASARWCLEVLHPLLRDYYAIWAKRGGLRRGRGGGEVEKKKGRAATSPPPFRVAPKPEPKSGIGEDPEKGIGISLREAQCITTPVVCGENRIADNRAARE